MEEQQRRRREAYAYWLSNIEGIGNKTVRTLLEYARTPEEIYGLPEELLRKLLRPNQLQRFLSSRQNWNLEREYEKLEAKGIRLLLPGTLSYPERLTRIPDRPEFLYVKGSCPCVSKPSVAIVGARLCSAYGRQEAVRFASVLAASGVQIVSGMARGIDGLAQEAALRSGGVSFAVLGSGVDICYPEENRRLYEALPQNGGLLSEYPPGTLPRAVLFPPRNRIISGLADCLLVVEAREKSGTFITVDMALEQGREVFVLPGRTTDSLSAGCNRLIRQGARMALSPEEMLEELQTLRGRENAAAENGGSRVFSGFDCPHAEERNNVHSRECAEYRNDKHSHGNTEERNGKQGHSSAEIRVSRRNHTHGEPHICQGSTEPAGLAENKLFNILLSYPSGLARLKEEMEKEGVRLSVPELTQLLTQLSMEGRIGQENGHFFVRQTEND